MAGQAAASSVGGQQGTLLSVNVDKGLGGGTPWAMLPNWTTVDPEAVPPHWLSNL